MTIPFWSNDPSILFDKNEFMKIWPISNMSFEEKLNSISRMVILVSILGFLITININFLLICIITLSLIWLVYKIRKTQMVKSLQENFTHKINVISDYKNDNTYITNPVT